MDIRIGRTGVIFEKGKLQLTESRGESLAQRLTIRLRTHLNTWFLEDNFGIDYFNRVFEKGIPKSSIDTMFHAEISRDERVEKILAFSSTLQFNKYSLKFKVKARDGSISDFVTLSTNPNGIDIKI